MTYWIVLRVDPLNCTPNLDHRGRNPALTRNELDFAKKSAPFIALAIGIHDVVEAARATVHEHRVRLQEGRQEVATRS